MLAVSHMSESAQGIFYLVAVIVFLVAAVLYYMGKAVPAALVALGLAAFVFVAMYNAFAAS